MRPLHFSLALAAFLLTACATATPEPLPTALPIDTLVPPTSTPAPQRAPLLRIAILGETTTTNVWALFDEAGADYWNAATQAAYRVSTASRLLLWTSSRLPLKESHRLSLVMPPLARRQ